MSSKSKVTGPSVISIVAAVLMAVLLVLQFTPFWQYTAKDDSTQEISISTFIWFPTEHKDVSKFFSERLTEEAGGEKVKFDVNSMVLPPILVLLSSFVGIILCLLSARSWAPCLLTTICGASGLWGYLGINVLKWGMNWGLHLGLSIAVLAVGVAMIVLQVMKSRRAAAAA